MPDDSHRPKLRELHAGQIVRLPSGHHAVVRAVDLERGCVDVEALPWRACFQPLHLRIDGEGPGAVILNPSTTPVEPRESDE